MIAVPDLEQKLAILTTMAADDREGPPPRLRHTDDVGALRPFNLRTVQIPGRGRTTLLRVLMTNACVYSCHYCPMRRDRNLPRTLLKPEELVRVFLAARAKGWCDGLFITTGIPKRPVAVMDDLIEVLELLRGRHRFRGYIHVKMVAGGDAAQIARLTALANRVSINIEAACGASLEQIAPEKNFATTLVSLERARSQVVEERAAERDGKPHDMLQPGGTAGMTMQFVVGATPDTDRTIMGQVTALYRLGGIHHTHFSAFRPIRDTPMEEIRETPALREHRLYQTDYLLRGYGFRPDEVVYNASGNLPLEVDPKTAWAIAHPELFPMDLRRASYEELLRVPGIGPLSARRIVTLRPTSRITQLADLRAVGVVTSRAAGFLTLNGRRFGDVRWADQLSLWRLEDQVGIPARHYEFSPGTFR